MEFAAKPWMEGAIPTRLYDLCTSKVADGKHLGKVAYSCLSYVWSQWDDVKLSAQLEKIAATREKYIWVDRWCIEQASAEDKAREIPKMQQYYDCAELVHVLLPDVDAAVDPKGGGTLKAAREIADMFAQQCADSVWCTRVWTMQEGILGNKTIIWTAAQQLEQLQVTYWLHLAELKESDGIPSSWKARDDWEALVQLPLTEAYRKNIMDLTHADGARLAVNKRSLNSGLLGEGGLLNLGSLQTGETAGRRPTQLLCISEAWRIAGERWCSNPEDLVYGVLALMRKGHLLKPRPGAGFDGALKQAAEAGLIYAGVMNLPSDPGKDSWIPALKSKTVRGSVQWSLETKGVLSGSGSWPRYSTGNMPTRHSRPLTIDENGLLASADRVKARVKIIAGSYYVEIERKLINARLKIKDAVRESCRKVEMEWWDALIMCNEGESHGTILFGKVTGKLRFHRMHACSVEGAKWRAPDTWIIA